MHPDIEAFYVDAGYLILKTTYPSLITWDIKRNGKICGQVAIKEPGTPTQYLFDDAWRDEEYVLRRIKLKAFM